MYTLHSASFTRRVTPKESTRANNRQQLPIFMQVLWAQLFSFAVACPEPPVHRRMLRRVYIHIYDFACCNIYIYISYQVLLGKGLLYACVLQHITCIYTDVYTLIYTVYILVGVDFGSWTSPWRSSPGRRTGTSNAFGYTLVSSNCTGPCRTAELASSRTPKRHHQPV